MSAVPSGRPPPSSAKSALRRPSFIRTSRSTARSATPPRTSTDLFQEQALAGNVGPSFTWNILNYGRLVNNVRLQDARFQELVTTYQNTVLSAAQDVENGLVTFLRAQQRAKSQAASVADAKKAVDIALAQYSQGVTDLTRVTLLQQNLVGLEDTLAQTQGEIATGLIQVYRALGRRLGNPPFGEPLNNVVENRRQEDAEERHAQHAAEYGDARTVSPLHRAPGRSPAAPLRRQKRGQAPLLARLWGRPRGV